MIYKPGKALLTLTAATLLTLASALPAAAQNAALGNIAGTVTDKTGAVIAGATVLVKNTDTGAVRTLTTDGSGNYTATFLQPGKYEVVLGGGAYSTLDQKNLALTVGSTLTVDATLSSASVSSEVVVSSEPPLIETDKTDVSQTVDANLVSNLPSTAAAMIISSCSRRTLFPTATPA